MENKKTGIQFLLYGYTGYIQIGIKNQNSNNIKFLSSLLTSYSLTRNFNPIKSNANTRLKPSDSWKFKRLVNDVAFDYPTHELSINLQLNKSMLDFLIKQLTTDYFHTPLQINFIDDNAQLSYNFSHVFITGFSLNISNGMAATASLSGTIFEKDFVMEIKPHKMTKTNNNPIVNNDNLINEENNNFVGATLLPYWNWQFIFNNLFGNSNDENYNNLDVMDFSINFSRQINPKFTCQASNYSAPPAKIISSIPNVTYECNYIMFNKEDKIYEYYRDLLNQAQIVKIKNNINENGLNIDIKYDNQSMLILNECYIDSITPSIGNNGAVNSFSINGNVYGNLIKPN